jgi:hypothetical protein
MHAYVEHVPISSSLLFAITVEPSYTIEAKEPWCHRDPILLELSLRRKMRVGLLESG